MHNATSLLFKEGFKGNHGFPLVVRNRQLRQVLNVSGDVLLIGFIRARLFDWLSHTRILLLLLSAVKSAL